MKRHLPTVFIAAITALFTMGAIQSLFSAYAVQNELVPPTTGIFTGPQFSQKIGDAFRSIAGCNKGSIAPANVGGATVDGLCWIDDSASPWVLKRYVNGGWAVEGAFDPSTSSYAGLIGGGLGSVASAATTDLNLAPQANVTITGTTTIGNFGSASPAGVVKFIRFAGALTLTNSSSLTVPGGFDLTTAANDRAIVTHLGSGNWEITQYTRASGIPVDVAALGKPDFSFQASTPDLHVPGDGRALTRTSYPAYVAKVTRAQSGTRTSGNATIASVADTSKMGAGMPVESTGVNAGCTIASLVANTSITLNSSSCVTSSGTSTVTVFLTGYGSGGTSATVGVPNCSGAVLAGREATPSRLTSTYFGGNSAAMAVFSGSESQLLTLTQLPTGITSANASQTINITDGPSTQFPVSSFAGLTSIAPPSTVGGPTSYMVGQASQLFLKNPGSTVNSIGVTSNNTSGGAHPNVQPTLIADCNVRVIP